MTHRALVTDRKRWRRTRRAVFARDGHRCCWCGSPGRLECDHIEPLWRTPTQNPYDPDGCQTLCRGCHIAKTAAERRHRTDSERRWAEMIADIGPS